MTIDLQELLIDPDLATQEVHILNRATGEFTPTQPRLKCGCDMSAVEHSKLATELSDLEDRCRSSGRMAEQWSNASDAVGSKAFGEFREQFFAGLGFGEHELDSQLIGRSSAGCCELGCNGDGRDDGSVHAEMWARHKAAADRARSRCPD